MKLIKLAIIPSLLIFGACHKKDAAPAQKALQNAIEAFTDSVKANESELQNSQRDIDSLTQSADRMFADFIYVDNPRLVEGYTILKSASYPLTSSGIVARITKNEGFELIVANVGSPFSRITVSAGAATQTSENVAHDQALNYRTGNMTTVAFSGNHADSIGALVNQHKSGVITLTLINGNNRVGNYQLSQQQKDNIARTWQLFDARRCIKILEHRIPLLAKKSMTYSVELQRLKEQQSQVSEQTK